MSVITARCGAMALLSVAVVALLAASAAALPEGRHYEMVSPPYKGGYGVLYLVAAGIEGEREGNGVVFYSNGNFAGQPIGSLVGSYLARRRSTGWSTQPLLPPTTFSTESGISDISPTLYGLYTGSLGPNTLAADQEGSGSFLFHDLYAPEESTSFSAWYTMPPFGVRLQRTDHEPYTISATQSDPNFCTVAFGDNNTEGALLPEAPSEPPQLYAMSSGAPGCTDERSLRLVAVSNKVDQVHHEPELIDSACTPNLGDGVTRFNAVASGGSEIFFETELLPGCETAGNPAVLFARLNGEHTIEISKPLPADCASGPCTYSATQSAHFVGANEAGTRVFFTTTQPLVTTDTDSGNDLYMAEIGCPVGQPECKPAKRVVTSLVQVSHGLNPGEASEMQGTEVLSEDGQHVYFVARGLLSGPNRETLAPIKGADNLYVFDSTEAKTSFIAELCSGPDQSGEAVDKSCPNDLTGPGTANARDDVGDWTAQREVQTNGDGRFLVFATYARLRAGDVDDARDIYLYDAQAETLRRISIGQEGYDANGNGEGLDARLPKLVDLNLLQSHEQGYRAMSEDGTRVVFETADPLSPQASNGLINAYEWHEERGSNEGRVALVSTGNDEEAVGSLGSAKEIKEVMITPSGRDLFFVTVKGLVPEDTDGARDVYDARLGMPEFQSPPVAEAPCQPDACHNALTRPAPVLVPGSVGQSPGENFLVKATRGNTKRKFFGNSRRGHKRRTVYRRHGKHESRRTHMIKGVKS